MWLIEENQIVDLLFYPKNKCKQIFEDLNLLCICIHLRKHKLQVSLFIVVKSFCSRQGSEVQILLASGYDLYLKKKKKKEK